jgi:hypothetical protein
MVSDGGISETDGIVRHRIFVAGNDPLIAIDADKFTIEIKKSEVDYLMCNVLNRDFIER